MVPYNLNLSDNSIRNVQIPFFSSDADFCSYTPHWGNDQNAKRWNDTRNSGMTLVIAEQHTECQGMSEK